MSCLKGRLFSMAGDDMARISDKQHKKIIALYAECGNYSTVARELGISVSTVKRHCQSDDETAQRVEEKKKENTAAVLQYMEGQKERVCGILDKMLDALETPGKIEAATLPQIATAFGILVDKYSIGEGAGIINQQDNNIFEVIEESTRGELDTSAIPELECQTESGDDVVEQTGI